MALLIGALYALVKEMLDKAIIAVILLVGFYLFTPIEISVLLGFLISDTFLLMVCSFLLSDGLIRSSLMKRISYSLIERFGRSVGSLLNISLALSLILTPLVPHPFPRIIILSLIFKKVLELGNVDKGDSEIVTFSIFAFSTLTSMGFLNGDVLLNFSMMRFSGISLDYFEWLSKMLIPSIIMTGFGYIALRLLLGKRAKNPVNVIKEPSQVFGIRDYFPLAIVIFTMLLFVLSPYINIGFGMASLIGVVLMAITKSIDLKSLKSIDPKLMIFITAAFAIGPALKATGLFDKLSNLPVPTSEVGFIAFVSILSVAVHMVLGSVLSSMSVIIPIVSVYTDDMVFYGPLVYLICTSHYILPFQHITILMGLGQGHYKSKIILRFGAIMSLFLPLGILIYSLLR